MSTVAKAAQAAAMWSVALVALALIWRPAVGLPQVWLVAASAVLANALQPAYLLLEGSRTPEDRGTAVQILWTVYGAQIGALVELVVRRPAALPFDAAAIAALAAMIGGLALRTWAVAALGRWFTWNVTVQAGQGVVTSGPFRWIRHPSYAGALVMFVAAAALLCSWFTAGVALVLLIAAFRRRMRHEEALLATALPGYRDYMARTGRLVPGLGRVPLG